jgi:hypothetical protein
MDALEVSRSRDVPLLSSNRPSLGCTENAIVADHATFDCGAIFEFDHARKYAFVREVHLINSFTTLRYDATMLQLYLPKVRTKIFEIDTACSGEKHLCALRAMQAGAQHSQPPAPTGKALAGDLLNVGDPVKLRVKS